MDGAGLVAAAAVAAAAVYRLYGIRLANATRCRKAISVALVVALLFHAGVLLSAVVSSSRNMASRVEETETKISQMEEIIRDYEKQNHEMMSNLASMLSKNPGKIMPMSNKALGPDGTENAQLIVTMKDADVHHPPTQNGHTVESTEAAPKENDDEAAPVAGAEGEARVAQKQEPPWRAFLIPSDHVFVLDCVDDELLMVRIRPSSSVGLDEESMQAGASCSRQPQAGMAPFLYSRVTDYTLFMSPPGEEGVVPVPWPRTEMFLKLTAAALEGKESPVVEETEAVPESFMLSPDVAAFIYQTKQGMTALLIVATDSVEYLELAEEESARAVTALNPPGTLSISFPDFIPR